ncbi:MAG: hypothetical protein JRJ60_20615 [Deltaproteobacteria bacterium]|nr:hypothetical protein [Deltaproteobacteria bacterium]
MRGKQLSGAQFYCQKPIVKYIVDGVQLFRTIQRQQSHAVLHVVCGCLELHKTILVNVKKSDTRINHGSHG